MSTKKKMAILVSSLAVVLCAMIGTVAVVLAARNTTVQQGSFKVTYTAMHVKADITAQYKIGDGSYTTIQTSDGADTMTFLGTEATGTATKSFKSIGDVKLTSTQNLILKYTIKNNDAANSFIVELDNLNTPTNFNIYYGTDESASATSFDNLADDVKTVDAGETLTLYIVFEIADTDASASFEGSINFTLTAIG